MAILYRGYVTHVIDPSSFWIRIGTSMDFKEFSQYEETLDQFMNEIAKDEVNEQNISQGDKVMVISSDLQHWQRAQVTRINQNTVDVFFIDLGHTEIVKRDQVQSINQKLFDFLPALARRVGLAGITPLSRSWTTRAITYFENQVLFKDVVVSVLGYDEAEAYGEVFIYLKSDNENWISLTNKMISEELGSATGSDHPLVLSLEEVENDLERSEELQRQISQVSRESPYEDYEALSLQQDVDSSENNTCQISEQPSQLLLSPADFMSLTHLENNSLALTHSPTFDNNNLKHPKSISPTNVPQFDFGSLKQTKSISLSKMKEDIEYEMQTNQKTKLELEIAGCEPGSSKNSIIDWGRSDLHIGQRTFTDVSEDISREIHKNLPHASDENELKEFFHDIPKVVNEPTIKSSPLPIASKGQPEHKSCYNEEEAYDLQKKISEIFSQPADESIICAMVHSVLEPRVDMSHDQLTIVISAILEWLIAEPDLDEKVALFVLKTYSDAKPFKFVILESLKNLKDRFVKVSQSIRCSGHYKSFAQVLAKIFIWVEVLPSSIHSDVQKYAVTLMERWIVFNKQRKQDQESFLNVEMMYLECVDVFMSCTQSLLVDKFHEQYLNLIEEMKEKLLNDLTCRKVRSLLLDLLLRLHNGNLPLPQAVRPTSVDVATQTYDRHYQTKDKVSASLYRPPRRSHAQTAGHPVFADDDHLMSKAQESLIYPMKSLKSSGCEMSSDSSALSQTSECEYKKRIVPKSVLKILGLPAGVKMENSQPSNDCFAKLIKGDTDDETYLKENENLEACEFNLQLKESLQTNSTYDSDSKEISSSASQGSSVEICASNKFLPQTPSNSGKWKSLSELIPQGGLWPQKSSEASTSVDPESFSTKLQLKQPEINLQCYKANLTGEREHTCDSEMNQRNIPPVPEWPEQFFTSVEVDSNVTEETNSTKASHQDKGVKRGKKTKSKFVPLSDYVGATRSMHDECIFETGQDHSEEHEGFYQKERDEHAKVIHSSRPVAVGGSSSSKRSLFEELRKQNVKTENRCWIPDKVPVCSSCKKEGHLIYDCPNDGYYQTNRDDEQYLLL
ncbi:unnamed protein product [Lymnaea stagnalis]|uniref:Uncharacterized protein n=1 Tax=Lymnaea stagnalis TaxID=6523 RepID=A0AAV2GXI0_LYMST